MTDGRSPAAQKFSQLLRLIEALDIELVDVEYVRENQARLLRLYIDKPDDCHRGGLRNGQPDGRSGH